MAKIRTVVFNERTNQRRPRTSWLAKEKGRTAPPPPINLPTTAAVPNVGVVVSTPPEPAIDRTPPSQPVEPPSAVFLSAAPVPPASYEPPPELVRAWEQRVGQVQQALEELSSVRQRMLKATEQQLVALAGVIAKRVIGAELATAPGLLLGLASEGIDALSDRDHIMIRIGTLLDDSLVAGFKEKVRSRAPGCDIVHDESIGPGGCIVETELGTVDQSVESRLDMVMRNLLPTQEREDP